MNIHNIQTAQRHGHLLAEYARMVGAYNACRSSDQNPYTDHLRGATDALPRRISTLACIFADAEMRERGCARYVNYAWDYPTIRPRNYDSIYYEVKRLAEAD